MKRALKIKYFNGENFAPRISGARAKASAAPAAPARAESADLYRIYMREIGQVPLLTEEEQRDLFIRARSGDEEARKKIITANLRLVVKIAREYEGFGLPLLDMINEGNLGLMIAVDRYDSGKGARLSTYAAWYIKQHIRRAIANQARVIRLPVHVDYELSVLNREALRLREELGRDATDEELGAAVKMTARKVSRIREAGLRPVSLDEPMESDSDKTLESVVADESAVNPCDAFESQVDREKLEQAMSSLSAREQLILTRRFGLDNEAQQTLEEISTVLGVTRERVRQLQNNALHKLRFRLKSHFA